MGRKQWDPRQWGSQAKPYHRLVWFGHYTWHLYQFVQGAMLLGSWFHHGEFNSQFLRFGVILSKPKLEHLVGWPYFTCWCSGCQEAERSLWTVWLLSWRVGSHFPPRLTQSETPPIGRVLGCRAAIIQRVDVHHRVTGCRSPCGTLLRTCRTGELYLPCKPGYFSWGQGLPNSATELSGTTQTTVCGFSHEDLSLLLTH